MTLPTGWPPLRRRLARFRKETAMTPASLPLQLKLPLQLFLKLQIPIPLPLTLRLTLPLQLQLSLPLQGPIIPRLLHAISRLFIRT